MRGTHARPQRRSRPTQNAAVDDPEAADGLAVELRARLYLHLGFLDHSDNAIETHSLLEMCLHAIHSLY